MSADISPELVERMAALVRDLHADHVRHGAQDYVQDFVSRVAAVVAELPKPVDPDVAEAKRIIAAEYGPTHYQGGGIMLGDGPARVDAINTGEGDAYWEVRVATACIKRGRELERGA